MRRPFPWFVLSAGLAVLLVATLRPALAQPAPADGPAADEPSHFPQVSVTPAAGGDTVNGKLRLSAITLKTDFGTSTIGMKHIKQITFQSDSEGDAHDSVQLVDKSTERGRVINETFEILGEQPRVMKRSEIREIKVHNAKDQSLVAILLGLLTLAAMEIVLGVDNIIFLAIIAGRLPKEQQPKARKIGLAAALGTRLALLGSIWLLLRLTAPLFTLPSFGLLQDVESREVSLRDLVLLVGGLFLIGKSTFEMHKKMEEAKAERSGEPEGPPPKAASFAWTIVTIAVIDIVFSLDSVITAVGMVDEIWVMIVAMVIAMLVMLYFAGPIAEFVDKHPTIKVLALSFLILIGVMLVAEGFGQHIDKGYIYAAMSFSLVVELVNMRLRGPKESKAEEGEAAKSELPKPGQA